MSVSTQAIAEEELAARMNILGCQYADAILDIAEGMALVGRRRFKVKLSLPITNIVQIAINDAFQHFPAEHWKNLPFIKWEQYEAI